MKLSVLYNYFIPATLRDDPAIYNKSKQIVSVGFVASTIVVLMSSRNFIEGRPMAGVMVVLVGLFMMLGPVILKITASRITAGNFVVFALYLLLTAICYTRGGIASPSSFYLVLLALLAFMFTNIKSGILWGVISIGTLGTMFWLMQSQSGFPAVGMTQSEFNKYSLITVLTIVILAIIVGFLYEYNGINNLRVLKKEMNQSVHTAKSLKMMMVNVNDVMDGVSNNDLSKNVTMETTGELESLKSSVNKALELLSCTIRQVIEASDQFNIGANELSTSAQTLAEGTTRQAANMEEISSSMNEIENQIKISDDNSIKSKQLANQTIQVVGQGNEQMNEMLNSINEINVTSKDVSKVIKVIDEIAFQTNLLALNAAVEAARAGKYGKGFAVVAEEVRNLAGRSTEAARETTNLINNSIKQVEKGVKNADKTAEILKIINSDMEKINDLIEEGTSASQEQRLRVEEINRSLNEVNNVVQQNSSISEQTASASEELSVQASRLHEMLNEFRLAKEEGVVLNDVINPSPAHGKMIRNRLLGTKTFN
ncbi:methyl-accepting chemotaxis protein [bacterium]|nr:methyl-accepting chemotaxis protein [bacterium]